MESDYDHILDKDLHFASSMQVKQELHTLVKDILTSSDTVNISLQKYDFYSGNYLQILDSWWRNQFLLTQTNNSKYQERQEEITKLMHRIETEISLIVKKCTDIGVLLEKYPVLPQLYAREYGILPFIELFQLNLSIPFLVEIGDSNLDEYLEFYRNNIERSSLEDKKRIAVNTQVFLHNRYILKNKIKTSLIKAASSCLFVVNKILSIEALQSDNNLLYERFEESILAASLVVNDYRPLNYKIKDNFISGKDLTFLNKLCSLSFIPILQKYVQLGISQSQVKFQFEAVIQSEIDLSCFLRIFSLLIEENMDEKMSLEIIPLTVQDISLCIYAHGALPYPNNEKEEQKYTEGLSITDKNKEKKPSRSSNIVSFLGGFTGTLLSEKEKEKNRIPNEKENPPRHRKRVIFEDQSFIKGNGHNENSYDDSKEISDSKANLDLIQISNYVEVQNQKQPDKRYPAS